MSIKFNEVTWYSKLGAVILFLVVVPVLTFYIGGLYREVVLINKANMREVVNGVKDTNNDTMTGTGVTEVFSDPLNGTYLIDGEKIVFTDGKSTDSETNIFGQPIFADLNNDGQKDVIFFVSQETGGTGIFFYVVAAVKNGGKYIRTKAVFLGDRIAPQNIIVTKGIAEVNFADRAPDEAMTTQPSMGKSRFFIIKDAELFEGEQEWEPWKSN